MLVGEVSAALRSAKANCCGILQQCGFVVFVFVDVAFGFGFDWLWLSLGMMICDVMTTGVRCCHLPIGIQN